MAGVWALGGVLKHALPKLPNRFIPLILLVVGVGMSLPFVEVIDARSVVSVSVAVLAAVGAHQLVNKTAGTNL